MWPMLDSLSMFHYVIEKYDRPTSNYRFVSFTDDECPLKNDLTSVNNERYVLYSKEVYYNDCYRKQITL